MKKLFLAAVTLVLASAIAMADDTPFAQRTHAPGEKGGYPPSPRLADIMMLVQARYPKLWYAGQTKNFPLADFEIDRIREGLEDAAWFYRNIPVEAVMLVAKPLDQLKEAVKTKDVGKFEQGFKALTGACNACHEEAGLGFIVAKVPTNFLYSDQDFAPRK